MYKDFQDWNRVLITVCKDDVILSYNYFIDMFDKYHSSTTRMNDSELNVIVFKPDELKKFNDIIDNLKMSDAVLNTEFNITLQLINKL